MENAEKILGELVGINSVFPGEGQLAHHIREFLEKKGFKTKLSEVQPGRYNLLAENGGEGRALLFYGHLDTVPVYGEWRTNPFSLSSDGSKMYGLGVCDMKGSIAGMLSILDKGIKRNMKLLFCVDEENISRGAWHAVENEREWFRDVSFILSGDAAVSDTYAGGADTITAGRRGRTVIDIDVEGVSSHGSSPERGVSAIDEAAKIVSNIKRFELRKHPEMGMEAIFVREVTAASTSLAIPEKAHMELDIQLVPPSTAEDAMKRSEKFAEALRAENILDQRTKLRIGIHKRDTPYIKPFATALDTEKLRILLNVIASRNGKAKINYSNSVADDNVFATELGLPVVCIAPMGGREHSTDEWISRKSLGEVSSLYEALAEKL